MGPEENFAYGIPSSGGLLTADPLQYFSWWGYAVVAVVYTALAFRDSEVGPSFFPGRMPGH